MGCASHNMRQVPVQDCPLAARAVVNTIGADHQTQRGQGNIPDGCLYAPEIQQTYSKEATNLVQTTTSTPGASDSFTCETQGNAEFDNDKCLRDSSGFGATDTCASSVDKCTSDSKDMHRCCSKACSVTAVCSLNVCNALAGAGDCSSLPLDCGV